MLTAAAIVGAGSDPRVATREALPELRARLVTG
jgi:hypothetical protein